MRNVLADLALGIEAATALALRAARGVDAAPRDAGEAALARVADRARQVLGVQARARRVRQRRRMECLGGNGYVEDIAAAAAVTAQAPLNSIWEGSGNIHVPGRAARDRAASRAVARRCSTSSGSTRAPTRVSTRRSRACLPSWTRARSRYRCRRGRSGKARALVRRAPGAGDAGNDPAARR
mgnify:CR=1 FL=1